MNRARGASELIISFFFLFFLYVSDTHHHLFFFFLAVLGLACCTGFFSSWRLGATLQSGYTGFSLQWLLLLRRVGSGVQGLQQLELKGSVVAAPGLQSTGSAVVHRLGCPEACGIFPDQRWNWGLLYWQADSIPLGHQEAPTISR